MSFLLAVCMNTHDAVLIEVWVCLQVLPPYIPTQAEKNDPALYAANVRKLVVSLLAGTGIATTNP
jgi:hypothetical protein